MYRYLCHKYHVNIKSRLSELVSTRRSTVQVLPLQLGFPGTGYPKLCLFPEVTPVLSISCGRSMIHLFSSWAWSLNSRSISFSLMFCTWNKFCKTFHGHNFLMSLRVCPWQALSVCNYIWELGQGPGAMVFPRVHVPRVFFLRGEDLKGQIQFQIKSYSQSRRQSHPGAKQETELEKEAKTEPQVEP